jgi:pimeloyl-ACP methyl ester carboxylesterase
MKLKRVNLIVTGLFFIAISFAQKSLSVSAQQTVSERSLVLHTTSGDIFGTLKLPTSPTEAIPVVLLIAGSGPTDRNGNQPQMQNNSLKMLSEALLHEGIASLSFDKRGISESRSSVKSEASLRFEDYVNDVRDWINLLAENKQFSDIIVAGHSEGALIGLIAAENNANVAKYISIAGVGEPAANILKEQLSKQLAGQPESVKDMIFSYIDKLENGETIADVPATLHVLFRPSVQPYMISWFKFNPQNEIKNLKIPVLIVQGTTDIQVSIAQAELLAAAQPNAQKVIIENMNHVLKDCEKTDMASQLATYNNPDFPVNKELVKSIVTFIKK